MSTPRISFWEHRHFRSGYTFPWQSAIFLSTTMFPQSWKRGNMSNVRIVLNEFKQRRYVRAQTYLCSWRDCFSFIHFSIVSDHRRYKSSANSDNYRIVPNSPEAIVHNLNICSRNRFGQAHTPDLLLRALRSRGSLKLFLNVFQHS